MKFVSRIGHMAVPVVLFLNGIFFGRVQTMDTGISLIEWRRANRAFLDLCSYTPDKKNFMFEHAKYLVQSGKNVQYGMESMNKLASGKFPDVRAQVFLGLRALQKKRDSAVKRFLEPAARAGHPVAQEKLGKFYINQGKTEKGLALFVKAAKPRVFLDDFFGCFRWYIHKPAIQFLNSWEYENQVLIGKNQMRKRVAILRQCIDQAYEKPFNEGERDRLANNFHALARSKMLCVEDLFYCAKVYEQGIPGLLDPHKKMSLQLIEKAARFGYVPALVAFARKSIGSDRVQRAFGYLKNAFDFMAHDADGSLIRDEMMRLGKDGNNLDAALWVVAYDKKI